MMCWAHAFKGGGRLLLRAVWMRQYTKAAPVDAVLLLNGSADLIGSQISQASNERHKHWVLPFSPSTPAPCALPPCPPPRRRACWPTWRSTSRR